MGWVLFAGRLPSFQLRSHPPAAHENPSQARSTLATSALASSSDDDSSTPKVNSSSRRRRRPTAAEVRLAIGVDELPRMDGGTPSSPSSSSSSSSSSSLMDFLSATPIGQPESPAERELRQLGEWVVDRTENKSGSGFINLMILCLSGLPVWILLLLVASGIIKLPFSAPFVEDLIM